MIVIGKTLLTGQNNTKQSLITTIDFIDLKDNNKPNYNAIMGIKQRLFIIFSLKLIYF